MNYVGPEANIYEDLGENDAEDAGEGAAAEGEVLSLLALLDLLYWYKSRRMRVMAPQLRGGS